MDNLINLDLIGKFKKATNRLVLLDYDGTLVGHSSLPHKAVPSGKLVDVLMKFVEQSLTKVVVISGRGHRDIDNFLGGIAIDIVAEHGAMIKENSVWRNLNTNAASWKKKLIPFFKLITASCPGSFIEEKHFSLTWHYRNVDADLGYTQSRELIRILADSVQSCHLKILDGNKIIEVMSDDLGKGNAVKYLVGQSDYDYILSIGDDKTDEDMFEALLHNVNADTIKVGTGNTLAKYQLGSVDEVLTLIEQLALHD